MFGLVKQPQGGVAGAVRAYWHQILQVFQAASEVSPAVLFQLIMSWPSEKSDYEKNIHQNPWKNIRLEGYVAYKWCRKKKAERFGVHVTPLQSIWTSGF